MAERSQHSPQAPVSSEGVPSVGDVIDGKYRVEGVLGSGGMGVVLSARHASLGQYVAIKVLIVQDDQVEREAKARLLREARAAAALTSDHVVRIYDMGEDEQGRPFIVMERLFGADLRNVLATQGPLSVAHAATLVIQACRAAAEAHALGIVHRDLKPSNLFLIRRSDGGAHVKVLDFGIAKSLETRDMGQDTLTGARVTLGSPAYMSPEQIRDARQVDGRTDIWSLGAILYELLTGKLAFQGNTLPGICAAIVADNPPAPSTLRSEIPVELDRIVLRCLEKDKTRRFTTAEALAAALEPFSLPSVDFGVLVPFSWLPETVGLRDTKVADDDEPLPYTPLAAAIESPRLLADFGDRTLESGKSPNAPASRARRRTGALRLLPWLVVVAALLAIGFFLATRSRGAPTPPSALPSERVPPVASEAVVEPAPPPMAEESTREVFAPSAAASAEPVPAAAGAPSKVGRVRNRPPESTPSAVPPEIRLTR